MLQFSVSVSACDTFDDVPLPRVRLWLALSPLEADRSYDELVPRDMPMTFRPKKPELMSMSSFRYRPEPLPDVRVREFPSVSVSRKARP